MAGDCRAKTKDNDRTGQESKTRVLLESPGKFKSFIGDEPFTFPVGNVAERVRQ